MFIEIEFLTQSFILVLDKKPHMPHYLLCLSLLSVDLPNILCMCPLNSLATAVVLRVQRYFRVTSKPLGSITQLDVIKGICWPVKTLCQFQDISFIMQDEGAMNYLKNRKKCGEEIELCWQKNVHCIKRFLILKLAQNSLSFDKMSPFRCFVF